MLYTRSDQHIRHYLFNELPNLLRDDDVLVVNDCRVMPARLYARRADTGTEIEILLTTQRGDATWEAMVKPGRSCKPGVTLEIGSVTAKVVGTTETGDRTISFSCSPGELQELLDHHGVVPLPPYIKRPHQPSSPKDRERYQTVYARSGRAIAAPTAGLHFTEELLAELRDKGCTVLTLTLDVGAGTFLPVKCDDIREHVMHSERFDITSSVADALNSARKQGRRIVAVGTTSLRALEACIDGAGEFHAASGSTSIFIHPPYEIRSIDALITNFHLPRSTLLMLVAAWVGMDAWRKLYAEALNHGYRFYSYGDAMLLV